MTSQQIISILSARHADDVFVPECKDGPSMYGNHSRLDAWAMKRSWSSPLTIGYEVKISRADYAQDTKWQNYLPLCNQLFFVCPHGLIQPQEVPSECGLIWISKTGTRAYSKKKASHRDVEIPESLWRYILMSRAVIGCERDEKTSSASRMQRLKEWVSIKDEKAELSRHVSQRIRDKVYTVERENEELRRQNDRLESVKELCEELGVDPKYAYKSRISLELRKIQSGIAAELKDAAAKMKKAADLAIFRIEEAEKETTLG